jgi:hypothetical protein
MTDANLQLIERFYRALDERDGEAQSRRRGDAATRRHGVLDRSEPQDDLALLARGGPGRRIPGKGALP